tara:strand:- start:4225 stop:4449 length:225 start_codon:yes stop_codon:yes gene_type:complete
MRKLAYTIGEMDYKLGTIRAVSQSKAMMQMIEGRPVGLAPSGEPATLILFIEWEKGWDKAHEEDMVAAFPEMYR